MPRLFTAIELPEPLRLRLSLLGAPLPGARWIPAQNLHLTLRFAGDIGEREADMFAAELATIASPEFSLRITGLGTFGGREQRLIWAGIAHSPELDQLQRLNERAARQCGLPVEAHAFKAHVTLARLRGTRAADVAGYLQQHAHFSSEPFPVERFVLMSARPGTGGGPYAVEAAFPLGDGLDHGSDEGWDD